MRCWPHSRATPPQSMQSWRAVVEEARRLQALAGAPDAAPPGLGEDLLGLALINIGIAEVWAGRFGARGWRWLPQTKETTCSPTKSRCVASFASRTSPAGPNGTGAVPARRESLVRRRADLGPARCPPAWPGHALRAAVATTTTASSPMAAAATTGAALPPMASIAPPAAAPSAVAM